MYLIITLTIIALIIDTSIIFCYSLGSIKKISPWILFFNLILCYMWLFTLSDFSYDDSLGLKLIIKKFLLSIISMKEFIEVISCIVLVGIASIDLYKQHFK